MWTAGFHFCRSGGARLPSAALLTSLKPICELQGEHLDLGAVFIQHSMKSSSDTKYV